MIELLLVVVLLGGAQSDEDAPAPTSFEHPYKCVSGKDADKDCKSSSSTLDLAKKAAYCHGPDNTVPDNTFKAYDCGKCETKAGTSTVVDGCKECAAGEDEKCIAFAEAKFNFKCSINDVETACTAGPIVCFGPKSSYKGTEDSLNNGGCGTCAAAKAAAATSTWSETTDCQECTTALCNGARQFVSFTAPLCLALAWLARL